MSQRKEKTGYCLKNHYNFLREIIQMNVQYKAL